MWDVGCELVKLVSKDYVKEEKYCMDYGVMVVGDEVPKVSNVLFHLCHLCY